MVDYGFDAAGDEFRLNACEVQARQVVQVLAQTARSGR